MARAHGQIRRSQVISTWGPGALIDLPHHSGIVGGLDVAWPPPDRLEEIHEPRLASKLALLTGIQNPLLYTPPPDSTNPAEPKQGIGVYRFPQWMVVQEEAAGRTVGIRARRLVHRTKLDHRGRLDTLSVVPTRFVRACPRGHIEDLDWYGFTHRKDKTCRRQLWLEERGTGGDLSDLVIRCECGETRTLSDASEVAQGSLGPCRGARPWLGNAPREVCGMPSRLLIRTAANAHFPLVLSALSLPEEATPVRDAVIGQWAILQAVDGPQTLQAFRLVPTVAGALDGFSDAEVLAAIDALKATDDIDERPVRLVELDALLAAPEGYEDDVPVNPDYHARRLRDAVWRAAPETDRLERVVQLHRLREVRALIGFTRFEAAVPDIHGEIDSDVTPAELALEPRWFPAVENRGEGLFFTLDRDAVAIWLARAPVRSRLNQLVAGHIRWAEQRQVKRAFPGGPFILLHTLSHLLIGAVAMRCGYPASSIRERIYVDYEQGHFGLMLYTASPDAEGTLGGLVGQARHLAAHLRLALRAGGLCSNDPVCAQHSPAAGFEDRFLHGASCHGCTLIAETSCEMRNDYLDRALVVPTLADDGAAFFDLST
jgi:hypothetical protein